MCHGWGCLIYSNGESYIGQWKNGQVEGYGEYFNEDGSEYKGQWVGDVQHGKGTEM